MTWAARASAAERSVHIRHLRRLWWLPGTRLGVVAWPPTPAQRLFLGAWHFWWQAHLVDCLLDAELRTPTATRRDEINALVRGIRIRNLLRWTNDYYDDVAWLGLALHRAGEITGRHRPDALLAIGNQLRSGWTGHGGGGIWWRIGDDFKNVPTNGPAAILLARLGEHDPADLDRAVGITEWITAQLVDPETGLVWDGLRVNPDGTVRLIDKRIFSYCQGVYLGACVELAAATGDDVWVQRAAYTVSAVRAHLVDDEGVLRGHGGGDGGLFTGILGRYLALAVTDLPADQEAIRKAAAHLVLTSAQAAWGNRGIADGGPLFGENWSTPSEPPPKHARDLSTQLSGWMLCEAAASIERRAPALL
jgi:predicted alpha-1,6-mannanase (GH76 family)